MTRERRHLAWRVVFSAIPFLGMCAAVRLVDRVTPYVLGLPFFLFWIGCWTLITSGCMAVVYRLGPRDREREQ